MRVCARGCGRAGPSSTCSCGGRSQTGSRTSGRSSVWLTPSAPTALANCQSVGVPSGPSSYRLCRGAEEVDKQFVDAFSLVVMHPVRCVGQALDAVEVGYVVAVGLCEFGA